MSMNNDILKDMLSAMEEIAKLGPAPITELRLVSNEFIEQGRPVLCCHPEDFKTLKAAVKPAKRVWPFVAGIDPKAT